MAEVAPFRGILYNGQTIRDISAVIAPPYDVIPESERKKYYDRHENNIIRLILGKSASDTGEQEGLYHQAAGYLERWLKEGVLIRDPEPAIYVYSQRYPATGGALKERFGYIARLRLEDFDSGVVMPHEFTFNRPRKDRLKLMRACRANLDQIFCVYPDPDMRIDGLLEEVAGSEKEACSLRDEEGIVNRLWRVADPEKIEFIMEQMADKEVLLADGHHRYEAALEYRNEMRASGGEGGGSEYVMAYFVNMHAPGLAVLPYHRTVKGLPELTPLMLHQSLSDRFVLREVKPLDGEEGEQTLKRFLEGELAVEGKEGKVFGVFGRECGFWLLKSREDVSDQEDLPIVEHLLGELDVSILHQQVIIPLLGTDSQVTGEAGGIRYLSDPYEALRTVEKGESDAAFFLNPANIDEIMTLGRAGGRMPQKSTFFYPKPITGLVINKLDA